MNLTLAFTVEVGTPDDEARADVLRQAREWADAEPRWQWLGVVAGPVQTIPERPWWWEVDIALTPRMGTQLELVLA